MKEMTYRTKVPTYERGTPASDYGCPKMIQTLVWNKQGCALNTVADNLNSCKMYLIKFCNRFM
jgi:hypothetical protein